MLTFQVIISKMYQSDYINQYDSVIGVLIGIFMLTNKNSFFLYTLGTLGFE